MIKRVISKAFSKKLSFIVRSFIKLVYYNWNYYPYASIQVKDKKDIEDFFLRSQVENKNLRAYCSKLVKKVPKEFILELAKLTQTSKKSSPIDFEHGFLIYSLVSYLSKKNPYITVLETGTARGFSSVIASKALDDCSKDGKILTYDILPHERKMFWNSLNDLTGPKTRSEILSQYKHLTNRIIFIQQNTTFGSLFEFGT